jgi:hypothetical protein
MKFIIQVREDSILRESIQKNLKFCFLCFPCWPKLCSTLLFKLVSETGGGGLACEYFTTLWSV